MNAVVSTNGNTISVSGTTSPGAMVSVILKQGPVKIGPVHKGQADMNGDAQWTSGPLPPGTYTVEIHWPGGTGFSTVMMASNNEWPVTYPP